MTKTFSVKRKKVLVVHTHTVEYEGISVFDYMLTLVYKPMYDTVRYKKHGVSIFAKVNGHIPHVALYKGITQSSYPDTMLPYNTMPHSDVLSLPFAYYVEIGDKIELCVEIRKGYLEIDTFVSINGIPQHME